MQIFEHNIRVSQNDLDELNHVNNVIYVQWINDISKAHWHKRATPEMLKTYIWVVIRHQIDYKNAALLNDKLRLKTYVTLSKGAISKRVVEIYNEFTNKLLVKSETNFCLLSKVSLKPLRIPPEIIALFS